MKNEEFVIDKTGAKMV